PASWPPPRPPAPLAATHRPHPTRTPTGAPGCVPAGATPATLQNLYTGVKTPGACHNAIVLSVSHNGGASFTGTSQDVRSLPVAESTAAQTSTDQYFHGMAFTSSGKLVVGAYDRSYGTDETTGFSDISVLTSPSLTKCTTIPRVTTASMPPATEFTGPFFGDYAQLAVAGKTAPPVWSDTRAKDLFLCPGTGTPGNPPHVCTGAGVNFSPANDQDIFT